MLATQAPYSQFFDKNGDPLDAGFVYFGQPNQNPETSPVTVYWDVAATQPAVQPLRTLNGYLVRSGTPAVVYVASDYSTTVKNRRGEFVGYAPTAVRLTSADFVSADDGASGSLWTTVQGFIAYLRSAAGSSVLGFLQIGSGANRISVQSKLRQSALSPRDFVSTAGTGANDTAAFVFAVAELAGRPGGGELLIDADYKVTGFTLPSNVYLVGAGGSLSAFQAATNYLVYCTGGLSGVKGVRFTNALGYASSAIRIDKSGGGASVPLSIRDLCYFQGFGVAIESIDGDSIFINGNLFINCGIACYSRNDFRSGQFTNNYVLGGNGVLTQNSGQGPEGVLIFGNIILPATGGTYAVTFDGIFDATVTGNVFDQLINGVGITVSALSDTVANVRITDNFIGRQLSAAGAIYGLYVAGGCRSVSSRGNNYVGWQQAGIFVNGASGDPAADFCSDDDTFFFGDPCVRDIQLLYAQRCFITGAKFTGSANIVEGTGVDGRVDNCRFTVLPNIALGLKYGPQIDGVTTRNKGSVTIPAAGTAQVVTHGLSYTPSLQDITLTAGNSGGGSDLSPIYVTNIGATQFTIAPRAVPASDVVVGWAVNVER